MTICGVYTEDIPVDRGFVLPVLGKAVVPEFHLKHKTDWLED